MVTIYNVQPNWTYSWLIWFWDPTASWLKYGTILAPQHEQKPPKEPSEPVLDVVPRVMSSLEEASQRTAE